MRSKRRRSGATTRRRVASPKTPGARTLRKKAPNRKAASRKGARHVGRADRPGSRRREQARKPNLSKRPPRLAAPGRGVQLRIDALDDLGCVAVCWTRSRNLAAGMRGVGFGWQEAKGVDAADAPRTVKSRGKGAAARGLSSVKPGKLASPWAVNQRVQAAEWAASLGHRIRLAILMTLTAGPASYQQLCKTTGLTAGPLQHHVRTLRQAGMVKTPQRNTYDMTDRGRTCLGMLRAMSMLGHRQA